MDENRELRKKKGLGCGLGDKGSTERRQQRPVGRADAVILLGGGSKMVRSCWNNGSGVCVGGVGGKVCD